MKVCNCTIPYIHGPGACEGCTNNDNYDIQHKGNYWDHSEYTPNVNIEIIIKKLLEPIDDTLA